MKTFIVRFALLTFTSSIGLAQAPNAWKCYSTDYDKTCIGNISLRTVDESGGNHQSLWWSDPAEINIAADSEYFLMFELYVKGVTDLPRENGTPDWQMIDAKAEMWDYEKDELIKSLPISIYKKEGNNDFYEIKLNSLAPSVVVETPESLKNGKTLRALLRIVINKETIAYRPVYFTYNP